MSTPAQVPDFIPDTSQQPAQGAPDFIPDTSQQPAPPQQPPAQPPSVGQPGYLQRAMNFVGSIPGVQTAAGAIASLPGVKQATGAMKGGEKDIAGLLDLYADSPGGGVVPGAATPEVAQGMHKLADWLRTNTETSGLFEKSGDVMETMGAMMLPGGLVEDALKGLPLSKQFLELSKVHALLEGEGLASRIARVGMKAATNVPRGVAEMTTQGAVRAGTIDPEKLKEEATIGGVAGALGGGAGQVLEEALGLRTATANIVKPGTRTISGEEIPTLASQDRSNPDPYLAQQAAKIQDEPEYQAAQQAGAAKVTTNEAQNAVRRTLNELNDNRTVATQTNTARLFAPPEDMAPYQFRMDLSGPELETTQEGQMAFDPRKKQIGTRVVEGKGPGQFNLQQYETGEAPAPTGEGELTQQGSHKEPVFQYLTAVKPGQEGKTIVEGVQGGHGTMTFQGVEQATAGLTQLDSIIDSPSFPELTESQQTRVQNARDSLKKQIDDFNAYRIQNPHFNPVDVNSAVQHSGDFAEGANQLEQAVSPVYQKLDDLSQGQWVKLREAEKAARRVMFSPTTETAYDNAAARLEDIRAQQSAIFDAHKTEISEGEWRDANRVWRDASTMRDIHDALEKSYNGVPKDIAAATAKDPTGGIPRVMKGTDLGFKRLQELRQSRPDDIKRVLGQDGFTNLYRLTDLLRDPEDAVAAKTMARRIASVWRRHHRGILSVTGGAAIGGAASQMLGGGLSEGLEAGGTGALMGIAAEARIRHVMYKMATIPGFADKFIYAVKNRIPPSVGGTLLNSLMAQDDAKQSQQQKNQPQEALPPGLY